MNQPVPLWCEVVIFSGLAFVLLLAVLLLPEFFGTRKPD